MTRRRKDPFAGKENVLHFRLVQRPLGSEETEQSDTKLNFDDLFEEYDPSGSKRFTMDEEEIVDELYEEFDESADNDFNNFDGEDELVDIDAELDQFAEDFIDIEGDSRVDRVKQTSSEEKVGEAAKYGILLDDRDYDYTKHLRRVGITPGAVFIQAPGTKKSSSDSTSNEKKQTRDFFAPLEQSVQEAFLEEVKEEKIPEDLLKANHEAARQQFRALLHQVGDDPILREVLEALEDERYVTEDVDDELVISLDNLNIHHDDDDDEDMNDFFNDPDVDILDEDEQFPDFIPSEALRRQMEKIAAQESQYENQEDVELDDILNEYEEEDEDEEYFVINDRKQNMNLKNELIDIEGDYDDELKEAYDSVNVNDEEAEEIYKYLKEHGRARGTTLYDKKRPKHLPPIHIAIAQYNELRRELAVNNDLIIQKYAEEDEEETRKQIQESEVIISRMVKMIDDPVEQEKRLNIETAKYLLKLSEGPINSGPRKIVESSSKTVEIKDLKTVSESESESEDDNDDVDDVPKINKGAVRSVDESAEEKRARKAKIKAEKKEKRIEKKNRK